MAWKVLAAVAAIAVGGDAAAQAVAEAPLAVAGRGLDGAGRRCVAFAWEPGPKGEARAGISVPVTLNGEALRFQFDTGADFDHLYGDRAQTAGWAKAGAAWFAPTSLTLGDVALQPARMLAAPDVKVGPDGLAGTLGLAGLLGRVVVLDYPGRRICVFADGEAPAAVMSRARYVPATLRNGKLFVPLKAPGFESDAIVFDTGSSLTPLVVGHAAWRRLTGLASLEAAPRVIEGGAWGKPIRLRGAPVQGGLALGGVDLGGADVFAVEGVAEPFAGWGFRAEGLMGNGALWDGLVVLDLTPRMRVGLIRPAR